LIPDEVLKECRSHADKWLEDQQKKPTSYWGAVLVVCVWLFVAYGAWLLFV